MPKQSITQRPKIMVASSVYGFEDTITQICTLLSNFGYDVFNSHYGTIPVLLHKSNLESCLAAVNECDIFLGIIRPAYGSGKIGETAITHEEFRRAIVLNKPRKFMAHHNVTIARQLLNPYLDFWKSNTIPDFVFKPTKILDDLRILEMYDEAINKSTPIENRTDHWVQPFYYTAEILRFIETNFKDIERVRKELSK